MDEKTLAAYESNPSDFAARWDAQPPTADVHPLVSEFFAKGEPTADIGCGSGREAAWLDGNGYPTIGYEAAAGLIGQARRRYPHITFECAVLPELAGLATNSFGNVFCETVIMHLQVQAVSVGVQRLLQILKPAGTLYVSWRVTRGEDRRDDRGRLYAAFDATLVRQALAGADLLYDEEMVSASSSNTIHRVVARKSSS